MKEGNIFQTIIIGVFVGLTVLGLVFFSVFKSDGEDVDNIGVVQIWGTLPRASMTPVRENLEELLPKNYSGQISYRELAEDTFNEELVEALAAGEGPDLILLRQDDLNRQLNKVFVIPYENFTERKFKDTYVEGAEIFIGNTGVYALPFTVDPIVMYWNRDILTREGIASVPKYWDEFFTISPKLTKRDQGANILQSTLAFGEYRNVTNAKEIISALIIQAGDPIVRTNPEGNLRSVLGTPSAAVDEEAAVSALRFYTEFSNPIKSVYSWNRALNESKQLFIGGDLAFYFGFASELAELRKLNPNLNFDVAVIPQIRDDATPVTFGHMTGIAMLKSSPNIAGSFRVATLLSSNPSLEILAGITGLPPVSRQLLVNVPSDSIQPVFYESALMSRSWLEPDRKKVDTIFRDMVESVTSGRLSVLRAITEASSEINNLFLK